MSKSSPEPAVLAQPPPERPEWAAEIAVSPDEVAAWLAACGHPPTGAVKPLAEGWDNLVFDAGELYVRVARRRLARDDILKEIALLPELAELGELATPMPVVWPADVASLEWPWFAFVPVPGRELTLALHGGGELGAVAAALGRFLRGLHAPALAESWRGVLRGDTFRRADMPYRCGRTLERIAELERAGLPIDGAGLRRVVAAAADLPAFPEVALVHGDLHFRHVLLGPGGAPTGIIDWGDAHLGHPSVDLHGYWAFFEPAERARFAAAYGPLDEASLRAARVVAVFISAVLALSADDFGLPVVRLAALEALRRTLLD
jgi:aminoglycoside phosphotransferase (APT) family kinase protein